MFVLSFSMFFLREVETCSVFWRKNTCHFLGGRGAIVLKCLRVCSTFFEWFNQVFFRLRSDCCSSKRFLVSSVFCFWGFEVLLARLRGV